MNVAFLPRIYNPAIAKRPVFYFSNRKLERF